MRRTILHPRTLQPLAPIGYRKDGRAIWPILGGSEPPAPPATPPAGPPAPPASPPAQPGNVTDEQGNDLGFPANTAVAEMNDKQAAAYWRNQSKVQQSRADRARDYDDVKRRADLYDEMLRATETPSDKQLREAREAGEQTARAAAQASEVQNLLRVSLEARGVKPDDLEDLVLAANPTAFVVDGSVSAAKVSAYAARITGGANPGQQQSPGFGGSNGMGQGHFPQPPADRRQAGVAEAQRRFGNRARSAAQATT